MSFLYTALQSINKKKFNHTSANFIYVTYLYTEKDHKVRQIIKEQARDVNRLLSLGTETDGHMMGNLTRALPGDTGPPFRGI